MQTLKTKHKALGRTTINIYDSVSDFADGFAALPENSHYANRGDGDGWAGGLDRKTATDKLRHGDLEGVAASDKLMGKLEDSVSFDATRFHTVDAMAGGVPNVPAMLAGQPMHMRQRRRTADELAPLTICVDTTSSGGVSAKSLRKRGAALLALARLLAARRPVTIWIVNAMKPSNHNGHDTTGSAFLLDTAPLDLARAAHCMTNVSVSRQCAYAIGEKLADVNGCGFLQWPNGDVDKYRKAGAAFWGEALGAEDVLFMPPVFLNDPAIENPTKWLKEMLAKYGRADND